MYSIPLGVQYRTMIGVCACDDDWSLMILFGWYLTDCDLCGCKEDRLVERRLWCFALLLGVASSFLQVQDMTLKDLSPVPVTVTE